MQHVSVAKKWGWRTVQHVSVAKKWGLADSAACECGEEVGTGGQCSM